MYLCPLCMRTEYLSLDSLCLELTKVTIKHIRCPVCTETVLGLDKYTIHLYSHLLQKEKVSKSKSKSETVTLNVLVKNMCKALDPQAKADKTKYVHQSQKHASKNMSAKVANINEVNFSSYECFSPKIGADEEANIVAQECVYNESAEKTANTSDLSQMDLENNSFKSSSNVVLSFAGSDLAPSVEKLSSILSQNFAVRPPPTSEFPKSDSSPENCDKNDGANEAVKMDRYDTAAESKNLLSAANPGELDLVKNSFESSSNVVLSFSGSDFTASVGKLNSSIPENVSVHSPPTVQIRQSDTVQMFERKVMLNTDPQSSTLVKEQGLSTLVEGGSPQLFIMLPEAPAFMNVESGEATEISQECQPKSELMTVDSQEIQMVTNFEPAKAEPRAACSSPFEFEEFIKLKPSEKAQEMHKCDLCNFSFPDAAILKMHQQLVHKQNSSSRPSKKTYYCQYCNKGFKMKGSLLVHHRVAHKHLFANWENSLRQNGNEGRESPTEAGMRGNEHKCNICSKTFKKEQFLSQHLKTHESKQWECDVCTKSFTTKYFLKKHKRLHTGDQRYFCELCNKAFTFQQSYHKHVLYHTDEKPYPCTICGRAFKELSTLHNHERIHTGEKPYSCESCGKSFRQRISCLVHSRIHTGAMPYECTACNKKFRYKCSEKSHKCPISPPGQIVLRDTDKKSKSLLSSIKKRLSVSENNSESSKPTVATDTPAPLPEPLEAKESAFVESTPLPEYYVVMPVAETAETASCGNLMSAKPVFDEATLAQHSGSPVQKLKRDVSEEQCGSTFSSAVPISAPDFFSDPAELFSSLTFSP